MNNIEQSKATLDEIVFEQRNKSYGAYLLRKLYDNNVLTALLIAVSLFSLALAIPVIIKYMFPEEVVLVVEDIPDEVILKDIPLDPKAPPPAPIEELPPPELKTVKFVPLEPAPNEEVVDPNPPPQEKLDNQNISNQNKDGKDSLADIPDIPVGPVGDLGVGDDDQIYRGAVTKELSFPGGVNQYIAKNLSQRLRNYISERGIKGRLFISLEVAKDGTIKNVEIPKGKELPDCKPCNEEIVEIVKGMQGWSPAENNGTPVRRLITFPVNFK